MADRLSERNAMILARVKEGDSISKIAYDEKLSVSRVYQIIDNERFVRERNELYTCALSFLDTASAIRLIRILSRAGINTVDDLKRKDTRYILGIGPKSQEAIERMKNAKSND